MDSPLCSAKSPLEARARATPVNGKDAKMKSLNTKLVLSAFGVVAMLTSPAAAQKRHHANQSAVYGTTPSYDESGAIPGYDQSGGVVELPNPDRYGIPSQR